MGACMSIMLIYFWSQGILQDFHKSYGISPGEGKNSYRWENELIN